MSPRSESNGSVTNQYQFVPEPMPNAGVVAVQVERRTLFAQEIAQQRSPAEEQAERKDAPQM